MKRSESPSLIDNPFIKRQNRDWEVQPPASLTVPISPPLARARLDVSDECSRSTGPLARNDGESDKPDESGQYFDIPSAAVEAGETVIRDHVAYFSMKLGSLIRTNAPGPRLPIHEFEELYKRNQNAAGHHYVIHQHDHPIAGTHYDLRLQFSETSSISFAIMYGLPGNPNSKRLLRNASETRVHNVWNHLIETGSHATGSMLIWDTGEYEILPRRSKHAPKIDPDSESSDTDEDSDGARKDHGKSEPEKLAAAFKNRKIIIRFHGTRLPKNYTLNLRLTQNENRTEQPRRPVRKRRRTDPPLKRADLEETPSSSEVEDTRRHGLDDNDIVYSKPQESSEAVSALEREIQEQEDEEIRRTNAYPGATNTIGSIHQRKWFLSIDRENSGFYKASRSPIVWKRKEDQANKIDGFDPFVVMGPGLETSILTGRTAAEVMIDEGVEGYSGRKGWRAVIE